MAPNQTTLDEELAPQLAELAGIPWSKLELDADDGIELLPHAALARAEMRCTFSMGPLVRAFPPSTAQAGRTPCSRELIIGEGSEDYFLRDHRYADMDGYLDRVDRMLADPAVLAIANQSEIVAFFRLPSPGRRGDRGQF